MTQITVHVAGVERLTAALEGKIPRDARTRVTRAVKTLGMELQRKVVTEKLAGQVLGRRTGRLARSINTKFVSDGDTATSSTGTNLSYGRFWELGFSGIQSVSAHTRRNRGGDRRGTTRYQGAKVARYGQAMGVSFVDAHARLVNQPARSFLRSSLADMRTKIQTELQVALNGLYVT